MGISNPLLSLLPLLLLLQPLLPTTTSSDIVYKGCANQTFASGGPPTSSSSIAVLSSSLSSHSSSTTFYKTTTESLFGLFQCRGDLTSSDCSTCISNLLPLLTSLCGPSVAARVQLPNCYALYQLPTFPKPSGMQLLFKTCASGATSASTDTNFQAHLSTAFTKLQTGLAAAGPAGFYATSYEAVYALAQCEGDLSTGDCVECVLQAVQKAEECSGAVSGQVYLDKCYITYNYYPDGVPRAAGGLGNGRGQQTEKTVAIVLGVAAGVGFLVIFLLFTRSLFRKKDEF